MKRNEALLFSLTRDPQKPDQICVLGNSGSNLGGLPVPLNVAVAFKFDMFPDVRRMSALLVGIPSSNGQLPTVSQLAVSIARGKNNTAQLAADRDDRVRFINLVAPFLHEKQADLRSNRITSKIVECVVSVKGKIKKWLFYLKSIDRIVVFI